MQEARFAGACQDQHAGRPAPSFGLAKGNQSVQQAEASVDSQKSPGGHSVQQAKVTGLGARAPRLGAQGLGQGPSGAWRGIHPLPPLHPPRRVSRL